MAAALTYAGCTGGQVGLDSQIATFGECGSFRRERRSFKIDQSDLLYRESVRLIGPLSVIVSALILCVPPPAEAKCAIATYTITTSALSGPGGPPVSGARFAFFSNGSTEEALKRSTDGRVVAATTAADGGVAHDFWFNTYSGSSLWGGDRCEAELKSIAVVVVHSEHRIRLSRFNVAGRATRRGALSWAITLPSIELERLED